MIDPSVDERRAHHNNMDKRREQIAQLNEQAALLQANLEEFNTHIKDVSTQYSLIQELGVMHGLLLMASHMVFGNNYNFSNTQEEEEES